MSAIQRLNIQQEHIERLNKQFSQSQAQTKEAFGFKWSKRDTYESEAVQENAKKWLFERYCDNNPAHLEKWLEGERKIILDVGCGSGYSAIPFFGEHLKHHDYLGIDISNAIDIARERFKERGYPGDFLQADMTELPIPNESVDIIFAEGVLHHTDNTGKTLRYLSSKLKKGGRFLFYVYKKKAVIREFTDDYIRNSIKDMTDEEAWQALMPLTKLGKVLGDLDLKISVPENIELLDIPKGEIDIQRLFYWYISKMYYKPEYSLDEMNHINFDWYRPLNCHRHTEDEIRQYCKDASLDIEHINIQHAGITVVAQKRC